MSTPVLFPIMSDGPTHWIPWDLVAPHEAQAKHNHGGQTLTRLAQRGGLDAMEAVAVLEDTDYRTRWPDRTVLENSQAEALKRLNELVAANAEPKLKFPPCPFCGTGGLVYEYDSYGTTLTCQDTDGEGGCHGSFTFPAFPEEVLTMWRKHDTEASRETTRQELQRQGRTQSLALVDEDFIAEATKAVRLEEIATAEQS